jgi:thiol-disulfide isomerase/thioredoxin
MSETSAEKPKRVAPKSAIARWGLVGVAVAVTIIGLASCKPAGGPADLKSLAKGGMEKMVFDGAGQAAPSTVIYDSQGKEVRLSDFKGKVVVVNFWATWCGPCVIEMPTLAKLAADYQGKDVVVIPVSVDKPEEEAKAKAFIGKHAPLPFYITRNLALSYAVKPPAQGMPTTIVYGRDGIEKARVAGEADWAGEEAKRVIDAVLAQG